jgi:hypothetical protein
MSTPGLCRALLIICRLATLLEVSPLEASENPSSTPTERLLPAPGVALSAVSRVLMSILTFTNLSYRWSCPSRNCNNHVRQLAHQKWQHVLRFVDPLADNQARPRLCPAVLEPVYLRSLGGSELFFVLHNCRSTPFPSRGCCSRQFARPDLCRIRLHLSRQQPAMLPAGWSIIYFVKDQLMLIHFDRATGTRPVAT